MKLHVVSFQVPFPPDYGGVIDVYYKLKALKRPVIQLFYIHISTRGKNKRLCMKWPNVCTIMNAIPDGVLCLRYCLILYIAEEMNYC